MAEEINYPLDHPALGVTIAELFNFGGHEAQDQRDVESYANYSYQPGWFKDDDSIEWWNQDWTRQTQVQMGEYVQPRRLPQQPMRGELPLPARGSSHPFAGPAATGLQRPQEGMPVPARGRSLTSVGHAAILPHMHVQQLESHRVAPMRAVTPDSLSSRKPTRSAPVPSTPARPPQAGPIRMPRMNPLLPQSRLRPPAGFNDQPPPRTHSDNYLSPHHERPRRNTQWPMNIEISMVEICTFGPSWFMIPECIGRAIRNGWSREALAKAQLYAEDASTRDPFATRYGRIQKQISQGGKILNGVGEETRFNSDEFRARHGMQNDLTANSWRFKGSYVKHTEEWLGDIPLKDIYAHVVRWPTGNDRMLMTQCLEFARDNPERELDTSHWDWIISSQGFTAPPPLASGEHRDVEALKRVNQMPNPQ